MRIEEELRHVRSGPQKGEMVGEWWHLPMNADCPGNAKAGLARAKEAMEVVLIGLLAGLRYRRDIKEWHSRLPAWFVQQCESDERAEDPRRVIEWVS